MLQYKKILLSVLCAFMLASAPVANAGTGEIVWGLIQMGGGLTLMLTGVGAVVAGESLTSCVLFSLNNLNASFVLCSGLTTVTTGYFCIKSGWKDVRGSDDSKCFEHCQKEGLNKKIQEHNKKEKEL